MSQLHDFDQLRNLTIGVVDYVSPNEINVLLETDAPQNTALNTGVPCLFPRINGFVLIPNEVGAVVGIINWIGTEHSQFPKRKGFRDYDLIDLPFPLRKMMINPVGTLKTDIQDGLTIYKLERGVYSFPSIGDCVIIPKDEQLKSIVENSDEGAFVKIGTAPIASNAIVRINPDKLFGRHVAVLGNTGSGKSCTAAGLIRWSLEAASKQKEETEKKLNCRFVILDPNGEYSTCFDDLDTTIKRFKIELSEEESEQYKQLKVPAWFWNSYEWTSFSQATAKTQRPLLRRAIRELKNGAKHDKESTNIQLQRYSKGCLISFKTDLRTGPRAFTDFPGKMEFGKKLKNFSGSLQSFVGKTDGSIDQLLKETAEGLEAIASRRNTSYNKNGQVVLNFDGFSIQDVTESVELMQRLVESNPNGQVLLEGVDDDVPIMFDPDLLPSHVEFLSEEQGVLQFLDFLIIRIKSLLSDKRMKPVIGKNDDITLESWLEEYLSGITIIDLSLIPADIVHLIVSVISRITFEAIQRFRRKYKETLPTVLMLEEAHNFIKRTYSNSDEISTTDVCSNTFEKIAKEGRKFGLSLLISSQRPSELSDTVLSQCNTFLLHRIVNDRDQDLVKRLVPDNVGGLLKELPILPTQKAILLGWASPLPILVQISPLLKEQCPQSHDPEFWKVWTGKKAREANWAEIAKEWQGDSNQPLAQDIIEADTVHADDDLF
jgi:uncharacterized protein